MEASYGDHYHQHVSWFKPTHAPQTATTIMPPKTFFDRISSLILALNTLTSLRSHLLHPFQSLDPNEGSVLTSQQQQTIDYLNRLLYWETIGPLDAHSIKNHNGPITTIKKVLGWVYIQSGPVERDRVQEVEEMLWRCEELVVRIWKGCGYSGKVVGEAAGVTNWRGAEVTGWRMDIEKDGREEIDWNGLFGELEELAEAMERMVLREDPLGGLVGFR